eukprot:gb/GFBE01063048.1/.p1 GENE.gb/GFBE01063048.1/~~gb/GFBE01063048.1/.p1  ORF type:complete len:270 (+),score=38.44 gb/GFBE01063048.1/:1-810(+)
MHALLNYFTCCAVQDGNPVNDLHQMPVWDRGRHKWIEDDEAGTDGLHTDVVKPAEWLPDDVPELASDEKREATLLCCCNKPKEKSPVLPAKYTVTIDRSTGSMAEMGLFLDTSDEGHCVVCHVKPGGLVDSWNTNAPRGSVVSAGDILLAINDGGASSAALESILADPPVTMRLSLQHPTIWHAKVFKNNRPLGVTVAGPEATTQRWCLGLVITAVSEGVISDHADEQKQPLRPRARIVSVNGVRTQQKMLQQLKTMEYLDVKIIDWPS